MKNLKFILIIVVASLITACYSPKILTDKGFDSTSIPSDSITARIPNNYQALKTIKGEGKAIVSEPNNSSHISINFEANRSKSLITIRNSLGIRGGKILSTPDSLIIYNRIDKYVRILPVDEGKYSRVSNLASVNLVEILTVPVLIDDVKTVQENQNLYMLILSSGIKVYVDKEDFKVQQVDQPETANAVYSRIIYDGYMEIEGFSIPRRITIISADGTSKVSLLIQSLNINPSLGDLNMDIPDDIPIYRK